MAIQVTKAFLPPLEIYQHYISGIWERVWLTNHGPLVLELEAKLKEYLGVKHFFFVSNGTIALQIAIKALELNGSVLTTPFSYVATTSSSVWEGLEVKFVDIDGQTFCLDPNRLEQAFEAAGNATAILATHVYGNACDVEAIQTFAAQKNIPVIYDGAHAFGAQLNDKSLLNFGDIATLSFHATKLYHTGEGGGIVTNDDNLAHKISYLRNFGHNGQEAFWGLGVNGKNSEFHAAMGLANFPYIQPIIQKRKHLSDTYDSLLSGLPIIKPKYHNDLIRNYAYYPIFLESEAILLQLKATLNANDIFPRRYFYPSLNTLPYVPAQSMPVSEQAAKTALCLPLYFDLTESDITHICQIIKSFFG